MKIDGTSLPLVNLCFFLVDSDSGKLGKYSIASNMDSNP